MTAHPGPGMYLTNGTFVPYISEEEFTAMQFDPDDIEPDPERFSWFQSGYLCSGTLQEYADTWERRQYDGDSDFYRGLSSHLIRWENEDTEPVKIPVDIKHHKTDEELNMYYRFTVPIAHQENGTTAYVSVDGRA